MTSASIDLGFLKLSLPSRQQINAAGRKVALTPEIEAALARGAVCAIGVSGGKDSVSVALATVRYLGEIGHTGPRILVHADLGRVEWKDSLPCCERLAEYLGMELVTVKRAAGDMLARWEGRWKANLARYVNLECVKLILPWSTPSMRFCTSELKVQVISSMLRKRWPTEEIVNVTGVRRQESANRAKMPVSATMNSLARKNAVGYSWNAVIEWTVDDVLQEIADAGLALHEAYTVYGLSRVSCVWCIMSSVHDLMAAAECADNHPLYQAMVELEVTSGFGFQGNRWLADVAPHLLSAEMLERVVQAKAGAAARVLAEAAIPKHLHYVKGWPTQMPTAAEADTIALARRQVAAAVGIAVAFTTGEEVLARYAELMAQAVTKAASKKKPSPQHAERDEEDEAEQLTLL